MRKKYARLIIGASESCADLLYATRFFVPDPIAWLERDGKTTAILNPLEIDRARRVASIDELLDSSLLEKKLTPKLRRKPALIGLVADLLAGRGIRSVSVPGSFSHADAVALRKKRIGVSVEQVFFPERELKSDWEVQQIIRAQRQAESGLARGLEVLRASKPGRGSVLVWAGTKLTSEILRGEIDAAVIRAGGLPANTIVAGGNQACDPHERGSGPLKAGSAIILDIFPRDQKNGYFGDLTRTVVRGRASDELRNLYQTVLGAQQRVLRSIRPGADGGKLQREVQDFFVSKGYTTRQDKGRWVGFFHGTGHSLGLEIHEAPRFAATIFKSGQIMTVEPGLYYPGIGGVRIEDLVLVTDRGIRNLTKVEKFFEI